MDSNFIKIKKRHHEYALDDTSSHDLSSILHQRRIMIHLLALFHTYMYIREAHNLKYHCGIRKDPPPEW